MVIRDFSKIERTALAIVNLGWGSLSLSEESQLENNPEFGHAVMKRVDELIRDRDRAKLEMEERARREKAMSKKKARQSRKDEEIISRKKPSLIIEKRKDSQFRSRDIDLVVDTILVVDDIKSDLNKLSKFLSKTDFPVLLATNMEDAMSILHQHPISMLVTDIVMPMYKLTSEQYKEWKKFPTTRHEDIKLGIIERSVEVTRTRMVKKKTTDYSQFAGFRLLDEARKLLPWLPVIIVSRYANLDMARVAIGSQVQDILSKQAHLDTPDRLLESVRSHMIPIHKRLASLSHEQLLDYLSKASEQTVILKVLIPILHKLGYRGIRYIHGANECGVDLIFYEEDTLGTRRHIGAQVKATKIHKNLGEPTSKSILIILQQVQQAFESTLYILPEKKELELDRMFVISSKSFTHSARDYIRKALMGKVYDQHIEFWDTDNIVELIYRTKEL